MGKTVWQSNRTERTLARLEPRFIGKGLNFVAAVQSDPFVSNSWRLESVVHDRSPGFPATRLFAGLVVGEHRYDPFVSALGRIGDGLFQAGYNNPVNIVHICSIAHRERRSREKMNVVQGSNC
ncbi:MAG: hypothetical protein E5X76_19470 [Mesorhizobium sp.]|uniref:hypothetical protein n=1 Tax=Mesorhizobium sp. TaxID=1871066 RepID=UPI00120F89D3|nr:hypothetical protein [Mesorhizobium sp.]TIP05238.1 MAG: hypothetical protein E5X72_07665 [Mesorhizobium sp.]TJV70587.1 MAG: hypothetical protein E5X76_19470 [Mesorhizobium sp.]